MSVLFFLSPLLLGFSLSERNDEALAPAALSPAPVGLKGQRDPFAPQEGVEAMHPSELILEGVVQNGERGFALISGTVIEKGESFGSYKLVEVTEDQAVLTDGENRYLLRMKR